MKKHLFTLLLAVVASIGFLSAQITVRLDPRSCETWKTVYLWAWPDSGNIFASWPGQVISKDAGGWYSYTFSSDINSVNIIWTNGTDQTIDITNVTTSTCYELNSKTGTDITVTVASCEDIYERVKIEDLYYNLYEEDQTAEVNYESMNNENNYKGLSTANIPNSVTYNGKTYRVNSIDRYAFYDCSGLTSVTIPESVTSIGDYAFYGCSGLTSITISEGVRWIGNYAFLGCRGLTSVTIPNSVTSIGERAFYNCSGLTSVTIGNSVTSIGNSAFSNCNNLTSVTLNSNAIVGKTYNTWSSNISDIFGSQVTEYIIGDSVISIGEYAFYYCYRLTSVTIGNSVISIGGYAFDGCEGLTSVTIGNSVTNIGENAFRGCSSLPVIDNLRYAGTYLVEAVDKTLSNYTIQDGTRLIGNSAFSGCEGLTSVTIPNSVTSIGNYAFYDCSSLTSVTIGNSVTNIGDYAFNNCSGLTSIEIPNSVTTIGEYAFFNCFMLATVNVPAVFFNFSESRWDIFAKNIQEVTVNSGTLTDDGFAVINRSYKVLKTLDLSATQNTSLADEAFKGCYNLENLYLPNNLNYIGYMTVAECVKLKSIDIPSTVTEIGDRAFEDCRSLKIITFGGSPAGTPSRFNAPAASASQLKRIGNWAFYNAHELQHLDIPEGVEEIGDGAFYGCTYLENMVLPSSVRTIGDNCFALCSKLTKIVVNSVTPPEIQAKTFYDVKRHIPVYVPYESISAYENDAYWQEFDIQGQKNTATALDNTILPSGAEQGRAFKVIMNGTLYILTPDGTIFNTQGARVK